MNSLSITLSGVSIISMNDIALSKSISDKSYSLALSGFLNSGFVILSITTIDLATFEPSGRPAPSFIVILVTSPLNELIFSILSLSSLPVGITATMRPPSLRCSAALPRLSRSFSLFPTPSRSTVSNLFLTPNSSKVVSETIFIDSPDATIPRVATLSPLFSSAFVFTPEGIYLAIEPLLAKGTSASSPTDAHDSFDIMYPKGSLTASMLPDIPFLNDTPRSCRAFSIPFSEFPRLSISFPPIPCPAIGTFPPFS